MGIPSIFNNAQCLGGAYLDVGPSSDWFISHVIVDKRVCNSFDGCSISFYEFLFSRLGLSLSFNDFEVEVLNH